MLLPQFALLTCILLLLLQLLNSFSQVFAQLCYRHSHHLGKSAKPTCFISPVCRELCCTASACRVFTCYALLRSMQVQLLHML